MNHFYKLLEDTEDIRKMYIRALSYIKDNLDISSVTLFEAHHHHDKSAILFQQQLTLGKQPYHVRPSFTIESQEVIEKLNTDGIQNIKSFMKKELGIPDHHEEDLMCFPLVFDNEIKYCSLFATTASHFRNIEEELNSYMLFLKHTAEKEYYKKGHCEFRKQNKELQYGLNKTIQHLKKSEDKINSLYNSSSLGMAFLKNGVISFFDEGFQKLTGYYDNDQSKGLLLKDIIVDYAYHKSSISSQLEKSSTAIIECQLRPKDLKPLDVELLISPSRTEDDETYLISIHDISRRKSAERLQDLIFQINRAVNTTNSLHEFIASVRDSLHGWIDTTNFYVALYHPEEDELSLPFHNDENDSFDRISAKKTLTASVIKNRQPSLLNKAEIEALLEIGEIELLGSIPEVWMGIPLIHQSVAIGMIGLQNHNVGASYSPEQFKLMKYLAEQFSFLVMKKNQEVSLQEAIKRAMESDKLKTSFLSNISHEIRTPMNAILGFSELLVMEELTKDEINLYVNLIHQNGNDLMSLINDMIDIAKIEAGEIKLANTEFCIDSVLNDVKKANFKSASAADIDIIIDDPPCPHDVYLFTDPFRLEQILNNLVNNAIKYGLSNDVRIGFKLKDNEEFIEIYVIDRGMGIPEEMQEIIFDPFRQINESHIKTTGGNGLGLSITKSLTKLLGGSIRLDSKEGYGSRFYVKLPIEKQKFIESKKTYSDSFHWTGKSILIAEDVIHNFQFLDNLMTKSGASVHWAKNGVEAVKMCDKSCPYDLILMDIQMPLMNGLKATRIIKNKYPKVPIIAQTAFAETTSKEDVYDAGCDDFIFKPIKTNDLLKKISRFLNA